MARWLTGTPPATDDDLDPRDVIEAETRRRMACITKAQGWDTQCERDDELACIDVLLDRWNELRACS